MALEAQCVVCSGEEDRIEVNGAATQATDQALLQQRGDRGSERVFHLGLSGCVGAMSADAKPKVGANTGNRGKGRPKGVPNKLTMQVKEMILQALDEAGGVEYLRKQATESPTAFLGLIGKVLPLTIAGDKDNPLHIISKENRDAAVAAAARADR